MTRYPRTPAPEGITGTAWSSPYTRITYATLSELGTTLPFHDATALTNATANALHEYNQSLDPAGIRLEKIITTIVAHALVLEARSGGRMIIPAASMHDQTTAAEEIARKVADHLTNHLIDIIDYVPTDPDFPAWLKPAE